MVFHRENINMNIIVSLSILLLNVFLHMYFICSNYLDGNHWMWKFFFVSNVFTFDVGFLCVVIAQCIFHQVMYPERLEHRTLSKTVYSVKKPFRLYSLAFYFFVAWFATVGICLLYSTMTTDYTALTLTLFAVLIAALFVVMFGMWKNYKTYSEDTKLLISNPVFQEAEELIHSGAEERLIEQKYPEYSQNHNADHNVTQVDIIPPRDTPYE